MSLTFSPPGMRELTTLGAALGAALGGTLWIEMLYALLLEVVPVVVEFERLVVDVSVPEMLELESGSELDSE